MGVRGLDFQGAWENIEKYNHFKMNDSVVNFANLDAYSEDSFSKCNTNNVKAFAATFFSFGLYDKHRNENQYRSKDVQTVLKRSVEYLCNMSPEALHRLSDNEKDLREIALKTFDTIIFDSRTKLFPPPFVARFYYWVLGVHNQTFYDRIRVTYGPTATNSVQACARAIQGQESTSLQKKFANFIGTCAMAQEQYETNFFDLKTTESYVRNKTKVEDLQDEIVASDPIPFLNKWKNMDDELVKAAGEAGYIDPNSSLNAISAYYSHLANNPEEASAIRRQAEVKMNSFLEEWFYEFTFQLLGDISRGLLPEFIKNMIENFLLTKSQNQNDRKELSRVDIFNACSERLQNKLLQRFGNEAAGPLLQYQKAMLLLKGIKIIQLVEGILNKSPIKIKLLQRTERDESFDFAFAIYARTIGIEQEINREMMRVLIAAPQLEGVHLQRIYQAKCKEVESRTTLQQRKTDLAQILKDTPVLSSSSLGIIMTKVDPHVKEAVMSFLYSFSGELLGWTIHVIPELKKFIKEVQDKQKLEEANRRSVLLA